MTPEGQILRAVLDLLAAKRILAFRNNVGVMRGSHKGKGWFVKFGTVGMADVVAYPVRCGCVAREAEGGLIMELKVSRRLPSILWIECKAVGRKQTPEQKSFQKIVEDNGHSYLVVDDIGKLIKFFKENGI